MDIPELKLLREDILEFSIFEFVFRFILSLPKLLNCTNFCTNVQGNIFILQIIFHLVCFFSLFFLMPMSGFSNIVYFSACILIVF